MKYSLILSLVILGCAAYVSAAPQLPSFEELGNKSEAALKKLQENLQSTAANLKKSYEDLVARGNTLMANFTKALLEKTQNVLDSINNRLNKIAQPRVERAAVDDFFAKLQAKAEEAVAKAQEFGKTFETKAAEAKDQATEQLKKAVAQAEQTLAKVEALAQKEAEAAKAGFEKADAKVTEVKGKLVNLLDVLEKKYFELREAGKKLEGNLREKRAQLLSKVKEMIANVQARLRGEKKDVKRQINWNELVEQQVARLSETISKLRERLEDATGKAKDNLHLRIDNLKTMLEKLQEKLRQVGGNKEKREVPSFEQLGQKANQKVAETKAKLEELKTKVQAAVEDLKTQAQTLSKQTQERVQALLAQIKDAVNQLTGKKNVEKRSVPDFAEVGKQVDSKVDQVKALVEKNLSDALTKVQESAKVASDKFNQAKETALTVAQEKVEMAKKLVDDLLARAG